MPRIDPTTPQDREELEDCLSTPPPALVEAMGGLGGDIVILGVGGKMGPTLARMARRATDQLGARRRVIAVSRFGSTGLREQLEQHGIETIACDLLDEEAVSQLPDAPNVVCMTGMKFGSSDNPALTWAMNCYLPALVSRRYAKSRIAVFSSGNVYGLVSTDSSGSTEDDSPDPVGEYAITVLGRERIFEYFSSALQIPITLLRLNYATELRYGVLVDLAVQVWKEQPIDVSMGYVNVIWQAEANAMSLASLLHVATPARVLNIAGSEILSVAEVCQQFGRLMNKRVQLTGQARADAFLSNAQRSYELLGPPTVSAEQMIRWTADWIARDGDTLGKPTHFETRDGRY